ncbi:MAG: type III ribulose-bisphosphate carboxylase [Candidatus Aenigmarchaeota archaeon]|nr:type III ribulose-bisphosphate carboxylase [Candidatus Aenigmarchaeota archaeon]
MDYVDLKYRPNRDEIIAEFRMDPNGVTFEKACSEIAAESSIGTWTKVSTMNPSIARKLKPHVFWINNKERTFKIAYPIGLFEYGNIPQLMSSIGGNIFGMKMLKSLRLEDIDFPESYIRGFRGPEFGIEGIRKRLKIWGRPLLGTIIKPKVGLTPRQMAKIAYDVASGGLDFVKDDENLTSMKYCRFEDRVPLILEALDKAEEETGRRIGYSPNITAPADVMEERAYYARKHGSKYIMVDVVTAGWSGLQYIRNLNMGMIIHAHRAGHAAFTKSPEHGISMLTIAKLCRLIGVDQIHVGTAHVGKMVGSIDETCEIEDEIEQKFITEKSGEHVLEQFWYKIRPTISVASGGLHPGGIPKLVERMGSNIVMQFGGGCHGHPGGSRKGAMAIRQAMEAVRDGITLQEKAKQHKELKQAIDKWGVA